MKLHFTYLTCLFLLIIRFNGYGQNDLHRYQEKYPDKNGVFLKLNQNVEISIDKTGNPLILMSHDEERLFLNDNYKYYTEESVGYSSFTNIKTINPIVYIPEGDKYKKIKITEIKDEDDSDRNIFHDDLKKKKFFYGGLEKGGKTTLNYLSELSEPHFFGSFYFSSYLPVESSKYIIQTPSDMDITFKLFGDERDKVKYSVESKGKLKTHIWEAEDLSEFDIEPQSVNIRYFATHIQVYINSYEYKNERKYIIRNLDDLYEYYRGFVRDVNEEENPELEQLADSITQNSTTDAEKVKAIFYWVQDNIKYVAFEDGMGGFVPRKATLVCDRKYGDCKDMASILYKMINSVGIPAYYTWIGSRDIPYSYNVVPTPSTDNHMICSYFDGEKYVFLDATGKGLPFGTPTAFIQGKEALIGIGEKEYKIVKVPEIDHEECVTADTVYARIEGDLVKGNATVKYKGYSGIYLANYLSNLTKKEKEDFFKEVFKKGNNKCKSSVSEIRGMNEREEPLSIDYAFEIQDYIRTNGDELYFNPFLKKYLSGDNINLETSKNDRENTFKEIVRNVLYVEVPEGYVVDYLPQNMHYEHDKFSCNVTIEELKEKNEIEVKYFFDFDYLILEKEDFPDWNEMIKKLNESYSELIIFKKKV